MRMYLELHLSNRKLIILHGKMKQTITAFIAILGSTTLLAQQKVGVFSIVPKIGVCITNTNDKLFTANGKSLDTKYKEGFSGGFDLVYQTASSIGISFGVYYSNQGNRYCSVEYTTANKKISVGMQNIHADLSYISVPMAAQIYVARNLSCNAGIQADFGLSGKIKWDETTYELQDDGGKKPSETIENVDNNYSPKKFGFSIPVGISYEYMNVILDARYNFGITNVYNISNDKTKKYCFLFTVGYRFVL